MVVFEFSMWPISLTKSNLWAIVEAKFNLTR